MLLGKRGEDIERHMYKYMEIRADNNGVEQIQVLAFYGMKTVTVYRYREKYTENSSQSAGRGVPAKIRQGHDSQEGLSLFSS